MRFTLIDRITTLTPGEKLTGVKNLSLAEEYLADHFPSFPVLPGVLMVEAMTQASAWLVRVTEDFAHSMVLLHEARNVKFANFVKPSQTLELQTELISQDKHSAKLKAEGFVGGKPAVSARLVLRKYNLADTNPRQADLDREVIAHLRRQLALVWQPAQVSAPPG